MLQGLRNARKYIGVDAAGIDSGDIVSVEEAVPLAELDMALKRTMKRFRPGQTDADGFLARRLHAALPFSRRQAGDLRMWHWLSLAQYPSYVRHRWGGSGEPVDERFLGGLNRNALARLWWIAELTAEPGTADPYRLTDVAFSLQEFTVGLFERSFMQFHPAAVACLEVLDGQPGIIVQDVGRQLTSAFGTLVLEGLSTSDLKKIVRQILRESIALRRRT